MLSCTLKGVSCMEEQRKALQLGSRGGAARGKKQRELQERATSWNLPRGVTAHEPTLLGRGLRPKQRVSPGDWEPLGGGREEGIQGTWHWRWCWGRKCDRGVGTPWLAPGGRRLHWFIYCDHCTRKRQWNETSCFQECPGNQAEHSSINHTTAHNQHTCTAQVTRLTGFAQEKEHVWEESPEGQEFSKASLCTDTDNQAHSQSSIFWLGWVWLSEMFKYGKK